LTQITSFECVDAFYVGYALITRHYAIFVHRLLSRKYTLGDNT
jgi:hypothetical protein